MSKLYKIQRWDAIIYGGKTYSGIYIVPDEQMLKLCEIKDNKIAIKIIDTESHYNNTICYAKVVQSQYSGGFRPNFQYFSNSIVLLPEIEWAGYPRTLGNVEVLDFVDEEYVKNVDVQKSSPIPPVIIDTYKIKVLIFIIILLLLFLCIIYT